MYFPALSRQNVERPARGLFWNCSTLKFRTIKMTVATGPWRDSLDQTIQSASVDTFVEQIGRKMRRKWDVQWKQCCFGGWFFSKVTHLEKTDILYNFFFSFFFNLRQGHTTCTCGSSYMYFGPWKWPLECLQNCPMIWLEVWGVTLFLTPHEWILNSELGLDKI